MCGLAAIFSYGRARRPADAGELARINAHMIPRGPDGEGVWLAEDALTGLAHRRLAIIDPGPGGAQPMRLDGDDGSPRLVITYNGEIYNFRELRQELIDAGRQLRTNSDTEVLLHLYDVHGADMMQRLRGMFAFAIHDVAARSLFLARDPFGIKPLYYADDGETIRVASQVKALRAGGAIADAPDPAGHAGFFLLGYVPEPHTMYRAIKSLPAGTSLRIEAGGQPRIQQYFRLQDQYAGRQAVSAPGEIAERLRAALTDSIRHHLVADVPVGVFLSAGLDSATITALAAEVAGASLDTMTLRFDEMAGTPGDEAPLAEQIAGHYQTRHQTRSVSGLEFQDHIDKVLTAMDQPSVDGVNTYFVAKEAKALGLKVALSGVGGDELFGGYQSFQQIPAYVGALGWLPGSRAIGAALRVLSAPVIGRLTSPKYASVLEYAGGYGSAYLLRRGLYLPWELPQVMDADMARDGLRALNLVERLEAGVAGIGAPADKVSALEMGWYMQNQLLRDADWAGMAHSLEIRTPLVDATLFGAVGGIGASKRQMAETPEKPLPDAILNRAKTGFYVPIREWLSGEGGAVQAGERGLRGWAQFLYEHAPSA
ncbi:MAG: asparagine synthase (glutamine-hydrolyzing) [Rhodospirillaceae bacterium]|nr:asparagine synthase (glutamine-hydrolyzing) [Rhodospirillaceae bacterium]MBT5841080.1 asparagine synthase (glutamine-hydrolyzing) [Rhodospirillaceae bacterium]MBT7569998.1 asparagine synthase (glutamine-hydrolyzing) [Rhodospirillaceae bacterium]